MHPKYFLAGFSSFCDRTAKNESLILIPCGGNCVYPVAYNPSICSLAFLIVAVEAMTFTPTSSRLHSLLIAASYSPVMVPSGPDIKCNSS